MSAHCVFKVIIKRGRKEGREGWTEGETNWRFLRYKRVTKAQEGEKKKRFNRSIQAVTF